MVMTRRCDAPSPWPWLGTLRRSPHGSSRGEQGPVAIAIRMGVRPPPKRAPEEVRCLIQRHSNDGLTVRPADCHYRLPTVTIARPTEIGTDFDEVNLRGTSLRAGPGRVAGVRPRPREDLGPANLFTLVQETTVGDRALRTPTGPPGRIEPGVLLEVGKHVLAPRGETLRNNFQNKRHATNACTAQPGTGRPRRQDARSSGVVVIGTGANTDSTGAQREPRNPLLQHSSILGRVAGWPLVCAVCPRPSLRWRDDIESAGGGVGTSSGRRVAV